jgi:hypothetical protein
MSGRAAAEGGAGKRLSGGGARARGGQAGAAGWRYRNASPVTSMRIAAPRSVASERDQGNVAAAVRVSPRVERPFSLYAKFEAMEVGERPPDPYKTPFEAQVAADLEGRAKWVSPRGFIVTDHRAAVSRRERKEKGSGCVTGSGPYYPKRNSFRDEDKSGFVCPRSFI